MKLKIKSHILKPICSVLFLIAVSCGVYFFFSVQKKTNPLELPLGAPEPLISLKGKLILKLFPGPPEYSSIEGGDRADYCWVLQLDSLSLHLALTTPVAEPASTLADLKNRSNHGEVILALDEDLENFCKEHRDQPITVEGQLFHAHTAHHYSPMLVDVKKIF